MTNINSLLLLLLLTTRKMSNDQWQCKAWSEPTASFQDFGTYIIEITIEF